MKRPDSAAACPGSTNSGNEIEQSYCYACESSTCKIEQSLVQTCNQKCGSDGPCKQHSSRPCPSCHMYFPRHAQKQRHLQCKRCENANRRFRERSDFRLHERWFNQRRNQWSHAEISAYKLENKLYQRNSPKRIQEIAAVAHAMASSNGQLQDYGAVTGKNVELLERTLARTTRPTQVVYTLPNPSTSMPQNNPTVIYHQHLDQQRPTSSSFGQIASMQQPRVMQNGPHWQQRGMKRKSVQKDTEPKQDASQSTQMSSHTEVEASVSRTVPPFESTVRSPKVQINEYSATGAVEYSEPITILSSQPPPPAKYLNTNFDGHHYYTTPQVHRSGSSNAMTTHEHRTHETDGAGDESVLDWMMSALERENLSSSRVPANPYGNPPTTEVSYQNAYQPHLIQNSAYAKSQMVHHSGHPKPPIDQIMLQTKQHVATYSQLLQKRNRNEATVADGSKQNNEEVKHPKPAELWTAEKGNNETSGA